MRQGVVSRYAHLKITNEEQAREIKRLRDFLTSLASRRESEAAEVLASWRRIVQTAEDPLNALTCFTTPGALPASPSLFGITDREVESVDARALPASDIGLSAKPWTSVAGDRLVSHLISSFFSWDDPCVYTFLDRELFIRDMRSGNRSQSQFCSPLLVNALCALRSVSRPPFHFSVLAR